SNLYYQGGHVQTTTYRDPVQASAVLSPAQIQQLGLNANTTLSVGETVADSGERLLQYFDSLGRAVITELPYGYRSIVNEWKGLTSSKSVLLDASGHIAERYDATGGRDGNGNSEVRVIAYNTVPGPNGQLIDVPGKSKLVYYMRGDPLGRKAYETSGLF